MAKNSKQKDEKQVKLNRYASLVEDIFFRKFVKGCTQVDFTKDELIDTADKIGIKLPKNVPDVIYAFRSRGGKTKRVTDTEPTGYQWVIRGKGRGKYSFALAKEISLAPNPDFAETKIPDATPGIINRYALGDEQALLAKIRFNRLIDIFTGLTCYSMQSHLRTSLPDIGQTETDEFYLGIDKHGAHYCMPVEAKGEKDELGIVQIENNFALGNKEEFANLICRPIAAQFRKDGAIVLTEFENTEDGIKIVAERHYRLVDSKDLSDEEISQYRLRYN